MPSYNAESREFSLWLCHAVAIITPFFCWPPTVSVEMIKGFLKLGNLLLRRLLFRILRHFHRQLPATFLCVCIGTIILGKPTTNDSVDKKSSLLTKKCSPLIKYQSAAAKPRRRARPKTAKNPANFMAVPNSAFHCACDVLRGRRTHQDTCYNNWGQNSKSSTQCLFSKQLETRRDV